MFEFTHRIRFSHAKYYSFRPIPLPSPLKMVREDLVILHQSGDVSNYMTVKGHAPIWPVQAVLLK